MAQSSQETHRAYCKLREKQREYKDRPSAKWLESEIKDLEIAHLKAQLRDEENEKHPPINLGWD